jgi:hypothetical protein
MVQLVVGNMYEVQWFRVDAPSVEYCTELAAMTFNALYHHRGKRLICNNGRFQFGRIFHAPVNRRQRSVRAI